MKYSVLLPTRNGGNYLRNCIESILAQSRDDFELIISDNANDDETPAVIADYRYHPQVTALRLDTPVSVTDNWTAAYLASSGNYVLMMGDDDFLLPDYFTRMDAILDRHDAPDCVVYNGFSYVAPGSIGGDPRSFYSPDHFRFGPDLQHEQQLSRAQQMGIVRDMFRWRLRIPLNMQTTLVARRAAERIAGGFFQPPFPDHYALNALLLAGARWVFSPERLVVVGVSPKSFGHFAYSGEQNAGLAYLGISTEFPGQLPGSALLNGTHVWLNRLLERFSAELRGVKVDRTGYVRRQLFAWTMALKLKEIGRGEFVRRLRMLRASDWAGLTLTPFDRASWKRLGAMLARASGAAQSQWQGLRPIEDVADIKEFAQWLDADAARAAIRLDTETQADENLVEAR